MPDDLTRINIPSQGNTKLDLFMAQVNANEELHTLWRCSNMNAVYRSSMSDHGPVHVQIIANGAYKMLRLLIKGGVVPSIVSDYRLTNDDAAIVVAGACLLHDIGMAVQRENHEIYGIAIARSLLKDLLRPIYDKSTQTIIASEIMHCIIAHQMEEVCLTIEAGLVKVADALDLTEGRSRIPFEAGMINIHSVSAHSIKSVDIEAGETKPIHVDIVMSNYAGIFQLDELLKPKLLNSSIAQYVEISASITAEEERKLGTVYSL
ncbi:MAG: HD domain-containing protein [Armatimonadota bacterium]